MAVMMSQGGHGFSVPINKTKIEAKFMENPAIRDMMPSLVEGAL